MSHKQYRKRPKRPKRLTFPTRYTPTPPIIDPLISLRKIGAQDSSFQDSILPYTYSWLDVYPTHEACIPPSLGIPSLSQLCARLIALRVPDLTSDMIQSLNQPCLALLWNCILYSGTDSFKIYCLFANFLTSPYKCHFPVRGNRSVFNSTKLFPKTKIRYDYLSRCLIGANHRIEDFFININVTDLFLHLKRLKFKRFVFLDFSRTGPLLTREHFILLFKLEELVGLDISNNDIIDDGVFHFLIMALKEGVLSKLRILRIVNCPKISKHSIKSLLNQPNKLLLVICDKWPIPFHYRITNRPKHITGKWVQYNNSWDQYKYLNKLPLVSTLVHINKQFYSQMNLMESSCVFLDIMFHNSNYGDMSPTNTLEMILKTRINDRRIPYDCNILLIDPNLDITTDTITTDSYNCKVPINDNNSSVFSSVKPKKRNIKTTLVPRKFKKDNFMI